MQNSPVFTQNSLSASLVLSDGVVVGGDGRTDDDGVADEDDVGDGVSDDDNSVTELGVGSDELETTVETTLVGVLVSTDTLLDMSVCEDDTITMETELENITFVSLAEIITDEDGDKIVSLDMGVDGIPIGTSVVVSGCKELSTDDLDSREVTPLIEIDSDTILLGDGNTVTGTEEAAEN